MSFWTIPENHIRFLISIKMPDFPVTPKKAEELLQRMELLGISEADIQEKFVKGSGKGGQKVNKTSNSVYLIYLPQNIEIKCHQYRSQGLNRYGARKLLCEKLEELAGTGKKTTMTEKIKKQKARRKRRQKKPGVDGQ